MKKYVVTNRPAKIFPGAKLRLTKDQAAPRMHCLKPGTSGMFEVVQPVEFKVGEQISLAGKFAKGLDGVLVPIEKENFEMP